MVYRCLGSFPGLAMPLPMRYDIWWMINNEVLLVYVVEWHKNCFILVFQSKGFIYYPIACRESTVVLSIFHRKSVKSYFKVIPPSNNDYSLS